MRDWPHHWRSGAGTVLGLVLVVGLLGVGACLKVPVGDPERSIRDLRVDGAWLTQKPTEIWFFRPWDARTWLVTIAFVAKDSEACDEDDDAPRPPAGPGSSGAAPNDSVALADTVTTPRPPETFGDYGSSESRICGNWIHKGWLAPLGGQVFLVLEPAAVIPPDPPDADDYRFSEFRWLVYRIDWLDADRLRLRGVSGDFEGLGGVKTRGEAERIIAENADNPKLYDMGEAEADDRTSDANVLRRAAPALQENIQLQLWIFSGYSK